MSFSVSSVGPMFDNSNASFTGQASKELVAQFSQMVSQNQGSSGLGQIEKAINYVQEKIDSKAHTVVDSIRKFETTGSAVALLQASHEGANKSVMVQLCGTLGKKTADNTEQLYKQQ